MFFHVLNIYVILKAATNELWASILEKNFLILYKAE